MALQLAATTDRIKAALAQTVACPPDVINIVIAVLLSEGHLLVEDVPGVGKTTLAKALASAIDCQVGRVQFTPDLLPSDLTGGSIYRPATGEFEFRSGPIFNQIIIADEINRASPKTQSALLEAMEEARVSIEGTTYQLPRPFLVVATQNPIELEGTYPLPEAQRDRFLARIEIGYPSAKAEFALLDKAAGPAPTPPAVTTAAEFAALIDQVTMVRSTDAAKRYVLDLVHATRAHKDVRLGASPRASIHLLRAAKAIAAMAGRDYVLPDDVQTMAVPVLAHRLILKPETRLAGVTAQNIIADILKHIPVGAVREATVATQLPSRLFRRAA